MICPCCGKPKKPEGLDGLGTALKPAMELICLARKPLERGKTIAGNVMAWGTGALNIGACRIPGAFESSTGGMAHKANPVYGEFANKEPPEKTINGLGRWPTNIVHDGSPEVVAGFPESDGQQAAVSGQEPSSKTHNVFGGYKGRPATTPRGDSGSAARFFATFPQEPQSRMWYGSKADSDDRIGSVHPTVKPIALIRWLTRLITPPGGTILDCFAGTGVTGEAALLEGFKAVLIEKEAEYIADIDRRMALALEGSVGRSVAMAKLKPEGEPLPLFAEHNTAPPGRKSNRLVYGKFAMDEAAE